MAAVRPALPCAGFLAVAAILAMGLPAGAILQVGDSAPDFTLLDLDGVDWNLNAHLAEGPVLLDFMDIDCAHCEAMTPDLLNLSATHGSDVQFVSIEVDFVGPPRTTERVRAFANATGRNWTFLTELPAQEVLNAYDVHAVPTLYLVDACGRIAYGRVGQPMDFEELNDTMHDVVVTMESARPTIAITSHTEGQVVVTAETVVHGTASDSCGSGGGLDRIMVRANGGSWRIAAGITPWSSFVDLVPGSNSVEAQAWDVVNRPSAIASVNLTYAPAEAPGPPLGLTAVGGDGSVNLSWSPPADDGGSPITRYRVYRGAASGGESFLAEVGNVTTCEDADAVNGRTYFYTVTATNAVGEGPPSNEASATPKAPVSEVPWLWVIIAVAVGVLAALAVLLMRKRRRKGQGAPADPREGGP